YTYNDGTSDFMTKTINHDNLGRIESVEYEDQNANLVNNFSYQYNDLGLPSRFTDKTGQYWTYGYDSQDGLDVAQKYQADDVAIFGTDYTYTRNDAGNRTNKTVNAVSSDYQVNLAGQITSRDNLAESFAYDADGSLEEDKNWTYSWSQLNQLKSVETKLELYDSLAPTKIEFAYDYGNRRVGKKVFRRVLETDEWALQEQYKFIYDGQQVIAERYSQDDGLFELTKTYAYGPYIDEALIISSGNNVYYPQHDRQYSIRALVDSSTNTVESYDYSPFGKRTAFNANGQELNTQSQTAISDFGYTGRRLDAETGLWYFRARYYSDDLGRFISRDPLGYVDGMSLYSGYFAGGLGLDPSGLAENWNLKIVGKSFILPLNFKKLGSLHRKGKPLPFTSVLPFTFLSLKPSVAAARLQAYAHFGALLPAFNNSLPMNDKKDGEYRLFGSFDVKFCAGTNINTSTIKVIKDKEGGAELQLGPIAVGGTINVHHEITNKSIKGFDVYFSIWGRPHIQAEPVMQWVGERTSVNIWQEGRVRIEMKNGKPVWKNLRWGKSNFPSHKLWINEKEVKDYTQTGLSGLWMPLAGFPDFVDGTRARK
ncbi:MAG: RHS repeat-associated core domain-containing protein, partial [Lentisphaeraceae bacterium]|nr:RHS repeat-associated core domain-containing protein [Lentisphaeraceae bacterium]